SPYYEKSTAEATEATRAAYAKVIWYETAMGAPSINGQGTAATITGNSFTVTLADATKYGNALIGVYASQASDTPLWSYHIWHPEDNPTLAVNPTNPKAMKLYENTYSGVYTVMPMALGATKVVVAEDTDAEKIKGAGLWYQWGRKDPLGRASYWGNGNASTPATVAVTVLPNTIPGLTTGVTEAVGQGYFFTSHKTGTDNRISAVEEMVNIGYSEDGTNLSNKEIEQTIDGQQIMVPADRHMINIAVANPTKHIYTNKFDSNWICLRNDNLWGNPQGYNYPHMSEIYKSVFDPCPAGYRIAPKDIWINFLVDTSKTTNTYYFNMKGGGLNFNRGAALYYKGMGSVTVNDNDEAIEYNEPEGTENIDWATDFYPYQGSRSYASGTISIVETEGRYYCSSPREANSVACGLCYVASTLLNPLSYTSMRGNAYGLRCVKEN
ncbi:MAG: hypothetical protein K2K43_08130, partial [Alistipes sp.]|nr:hypothetical protein [Alistipes sp.]